MFFAVHTSLGTFRVEAPNPQEARAIVGKKHPDAQITKVKKATSKHEAA